MKVHLIRKETIEAFTKQNAKAECRLTNGVVS